MIFQKREVHQLSTSNGAFNDVKFGAAPMKAENGVGQENQWSPLRLPLKIKKGETCTTCYARFALTRNA